MEARLTELEIKAAYAEDLLESLNATVYRQQQQIDLLQRELRALREELRAGAAGQDAGSRDELPPHY